MVSKTKVSPYSALAPIYDQVMFHVNYKKWANYVIKIANKFAKSSKIIFDISCGTGSCDFYLSKQKFNVIGMDAALAMVQQARIKYNKENMLFFCGDMQHPALSTPVDMAISLYDSMNYLISDASWNTCLQNIHTILPAGGLFVFDVSTVYNSQIDFSQYIQKERFKHGTYKRQSWFDSKKFIQTNYFEIQYQNVPQTIFCETHQQKIRYLDEIESLIAQSPFEYIASFKDFTFLPRSEKSERVHFVLKKRKL